MKLLKFTELNDNTIYRLLHGGEVDHGYNYEIRKGGLYNLTKCRTSSVPFNLKTRFIESSVKFKRYDTLEYEVEFTSYGLKIGCQNINKWSAIQFANDILEKYENDIINSLTVDDIPF